ncbi:MAG: bifunctional pyr operon transcriptional regulator/uracil phosphoribosyltransferase PyrR, partial [Aquincola sp.]|nr:bifunctional pyr operon transcriptional regulator/uracil phosphoribosyltransferase PyrR [Aquincola sp.]
MTTDLTLDAEALYAALRDGVRRLLADQHDAVLVGIWSGGAWLAERLQADLGLAGEAGVITSTLHRDDFAERGLAADRGSTKLPFAVDGQRIVLIDDVLNTGRTIRAVLNELYDFGRPASVTLAVLVDRGGR